MHDMLEFNPKFRANASELLKSDVFDTCRKLLPDHEKSPQNIIKLDYDQKGSFDYNEGKVLSHTQKELRAILLEEIRIVK